MKILSAVLFLFFLFAFTYGHATPQQKTQVKVVFDSFHISIGDLTKRFDSKSTEGIEADITRSIDSIAGNVKFLETVMNLGRPIPREYLEGLSLDAQLLKKFTEQESGTASERQALYDGLKEIESDLLLKVGGPRSGGEVARVVEVIVRAKKGDQDVSAYQVWYVAKGWADDSSKFKVFDRLTDPSNPSSKKLAPGNYLFWLDKGGVKTDRQPHSVGENDNPRKTIELPVP